MKFFLYLSWKVYLLKYVKISHTGFEGGLQVFNEPKWKLEIALQYFWKYISKVSELFNICSGFIQYEICQLESFHYISKAFCSWCLPFIFSENKMFITQENWGFVFSDI